VRAALERHDAACEVPDLDAFRTLRFSYWQPIDYRTMLEAAAARAEALGIRGVILGNWWSVQSADAAEVMMGIARECLEREKPFVPPVALLSGGEMTVPVGNAAGIGGRNQEFVLCAAQRMAECRGSGLVVGSVDSDGTDGPGPQLQASAAALPCLAGGIADETTWASAASVNLDLAAELERHNSSPALLALKSAIHTGNTGICAGDLRVILIPRRG
jgi:glycerate-2-kinase